jgi:hypothetical protein
MGLDFALAGRYGVVINLLWIAGLYLALLNWNRRALRRFNLTVIAVLPGIFVWTSQVNYLPTGDDRYTCALYWPQPCQFKIHPHDDYLTERIQLLKDLRLSLFASPPS